MVKVTAEQRERMKDTLIRTLAGSAIRPTREIGNDCLLLETSDGPVTLFYHSDTNEVEETKRRIRSLQEDGRVVSNIFYKDQETFFVPLTEDQVKQKIKKSLRGLDYNKLMSVVSLRDKEQLALAIQSGDRTIAYYQPDTTHDGGRLREGLVNFQMKPFDKNYIYIPETRNGYKHIMEEHGERYTDFAISSDKKVLNGRVCFKPVRNNSLVAMLTSAEPAIQATLF